MRNRLLVSAWILFLFAPLLPAQAPDPSVSNAAPIPGAGHSYIGMGVETVSPVDGLLTFELPINMPHGRELSLPFGFHYSSSDPFYLTNNNNGTLGTSLFYKPRPVMPWEVNGWGYDLPTLVGSAKILARWQDTSVHQCDVTKDFVFRGMGGPTYTLGLGKISVDSGFATGTGCASSLDSNSSSRHGMAAVFTTTTGVNLPLALPINVVDQSGTVYSFPGGFTASITPGSEPPVWQYLPSTIIDRNGNRIGLQNSTLTAGGLQPTANGFYDTLGRPVVSWTGIGHDNDQVTVSGMSGITIHWATKPISFPETVHTPSGAWSTICTHGTTPPTMINVVTQIALPNGEAYNFEYDATYGRVNKIWFPGGGYVRYQWGLNTSSSGAIFVTQYPTSQAGAPQTCTVYYDTPAVTDRWVSYDGVNEVLHQNFTYDAPTWFANGNPILWSAKRTKVTTTDTLTNQTTVTYYNYSPVNADAGGPYDLQLGNNVARQAAVETSVVYQDVSNHTFRTLNQSWNNLFAMRGAQTILDNGQGNATLRCYDSNEQLTDTFEYGFQSEGTKPADPTCASSTGLTTTAIGPLRRHNVTAYHNFRGASPSTNIVNAPDSVTTYDGSGTQVAKATLAYTETVTPSGVATGRAALPGLRGNLASATLWLNTGGTSPVASYTYYDTGQLQSMTDACGNTTCSDMTGSSHTTTFSYSDNFVSGTGTPPGQTNAYLRQIVYPNTGIAHSQTFTWGYNDGLLRSATDDQNALTTTYQYNDPLLRLKTATSPTAGTTSYSYNDTPPSPSITTTTQIDTSPQYLVSVNVFDGLGHSKQSKLTSDPQGTIFSDTTFDGFGRVKTQSNPYRSGTDPTTTNGTTTYFYDTLGRPCLVVPPDATFSGSSCPSTQPTNTVFTTYSGNCTTVSDETKKTRKSCSDGLGRLSTVYEDPASLNYETDYQYDALDNLSCTAQKGTNTGTFANCASTPASWRPRGFTYDSLSRLLTSNDPEIGILRYTYDANGNVSTKQDARPVTIAYGYDVLNRAKSKTYSNGDPTVTYTYDTSTTGTTNVGHRTGMTDGAGSSTWGYSDASLGHVYYSRTNNSSPANITQVRDYYRDYLGNVFALHYPNSGMSLNYVYDSAGRPSYVYNSENGGNFAGQSATPPPGCPTTGACYTPQGTIYNFSIEETLDITTTSNNRLQPLRIKGTSTGGNAMDISYGYIDSATGGNSSMARTILNNLNASRSQNFAYDQLNRISTAGTSATSGSYCWGYSYSYDAWGNLLSQAGLGGYTGCSQTIMSSVTASTKNQLSSLTYGLSGNTLTDGSCTYAWDGEGRLKSACGVTYAYDGDGRRVAKVGSKLYWYGPSGEVLDETDSAGHITSTYYYFAGKRYEKASLTSPLTYYVADALGTAKVLTNSTGVVCYDSDFTPFGGERAYTNTCSQNYKFTGKERDTETGNDDFGARSYSWRWGRFMTPDPLPGSLLNPQSLNRYSYVLNNPETFTDPFGLECVWDDGSFDSNDDPDTGSGSSCNANGGTWIDFGGTMGDWSPTANPDIAHWADIVRSADTSVEVKADPLPPDGGTIGWVKDWWQSFKSINGIQVNVQVNQCAASKAVSAASLLNWDERNPFVGAFAGNDVATLSRFVYGPGRGQAALDLAVSNPGKYSLMGTAIDTVAGQLPVGGTVYTASARSVATAYGPAIEMVPVSKTLGDVAGKFAGRVGGVVAKVKVVFDAAAYINALYTCATD